MTTSAERTIGLGHQVALAHLCLELGLGERREKNRRLPGAMQGASGWFVSPAEMVQLEQEMARRLEGRHERRLAQRRAQSARDKAARPKPRPARERALETWRRECADPQSVRTPEQAWAYARASTFGLAPDAPMPTEPPPARLPLSMVVVELAGRRDGGEHGRTETRVEREARLKREERARARSRPPSCSTAGTIRGRS